jgi:DNA-binding MarR family transcriptional regulator
MSSRPETTKSGEFERLLHAVIEKAKRKGFHHNRMLVKLLNVAKLTGNEEILRTLQRNLEAIPDVAQPLRPGLVSKPFEPPPQRAGRSGILIGRCPDTSRELWADDYAKNFLICGTIGSGKTNTILNLANGIVQQGGTAFIFQRRRGDYDFLLKTVKEKAMLIPLRRLRFPVFNPPPQVNWQEWAVLMAMAFCHTYELLVGSRFALGYRLVNFFKEYLAKLGRYPTIVEFAEFLDELNPTGHEKDYFDAFRQRTRYLLHVHDEMFHVAQGHDIIGLSESGKIVVFHLDADEQVNEWLILCLVHYVYKYRENAHKRHCPLLFVIEEARSMLRQKNPEYYISDLDHLVSTSRTVQIGYVFGDQVPAQLSEAITACTKYKFFFNCQAEQQKAAAKILGLNKEQASYLYRCRVGEAVVRISGADYPEPFVIQTDSFPHEPAQKPSWDEVLRLAEPTLQELDQHVIPLVEEAPAAEASRSQDGAGGLSPSEWELLGAVAVNPARQVKEYEELLKWNPRKLAGALKYLENKGFVKKARVVTGKSGQPVAVLPTQQALAWFEENNLPYTPLPKGGPVHAFWVFKAEQHLKKLGYETAVEYAFSQDVFADVYGEMNGKRLVVEVETSNHSLDNLHKYEPWLEALDLIVLAVDDKSPTGDGDQPRAFFDFLEGKAKRAGQEKLKVVRCQERFKDAL